MRLFIKNMVCNRCKLAVKTLLEQNDLHPTTIELGEVDLQEEQLPETQLRLLEEQLNALGFELIGDRKSRIIEQIKNVVISLVHYTDGDQPRQKHSEVIATALHLDHQYLSKLFSEVAGITIEQYIINQKVEKIKEYLTYDELTLSEIADRMGYSSVAHLSTQFKKVTGFTPSYFKKMDIHHRRPLDEIGTK